MKKLIFILPVMVLFLFMGTLFHSCDFNTGDYGTLLVSLPGARALTAISPSDFAAPLVYRITCTGPGAPAPADMQAGNVRPISLIAGDWSVTVTVFNSADMNDQLGSLTKPVTIEAGKTSTLPMDITIETDSCKITGFTLIIGDNQYTASNVDQSTRVITVRIPANLVPTGNTQVSYTVTHTGRRENGVNPAQGTTIGFQDIDYNKGSPTGSGITVTAVDGTQSSAYYVNVEPIETSGGGLTFYGNWNLPWTSFGFSQTPTAPGTVLTSSPMAEFIAAAAAEEYEDEPGFEGAIVVLSGNPTSMATTFGVALTASHGFIDMSSLGGGSQNIYMKTTDAVYMVMMMPIALAGPPTELMIMFMRYDYTGRTFDVWDGTDWNDALADIASDPSGETNYVINVKTNITGAAAGSFGSNSPIRVTINGNYTVTIDGSGGALLSFFDAGQTVIANDVDFVGNASNSSPLIHVERGTFVLQGSASVSGNKNSGSFEGGGLRVHWGGTFIMKDSSKVYGNTSQDGSGGVLLTVASSSSGIFYLAGGTVYGNDSGDNSPANNNTNSGGSGRDALDGGGKAEYGYFTDPDDPTTWVRNGDIMDALTNDTTKSFRREGGVFQSWSGTAWVTVP